MLTSNGRTGLERVLMGSVAEDVARICTCPVLILGPQTSEVRRIKDEIQAMSNGCRTAEEPSRRRPGEATYEI